MEMSTNLFVNLEIESSLNELLDTYVGYVENVLIEEEIMESNKLMF